MCSEAHRDKNVAVFQPLSINKILEMDMNREHRVTVIGFTVLTIFFSHRAYKTTGGKYILNFPFIMRIANNETARINYELRVTFRRMASISAITDNFRAATEIDSILINVVNDAAMPSTIVCDPDPIGEERKRNLIFLTILGLSSSK